VRARGWPFQRFAGVSCHQSHAPSDNPVASALAAAWVSVAMQQPTDAFVDRLIAQMTLEISMLHGATDPERYGQAYLPGV
jgi:hypothetical protein